MYRRKLVGLLLLVAFIAPMGFGGLAFAGKINMRNLHKKLDEIKAQTQTHYDILSESCPESWKKVLPAADRFELVMGGAAVLDKETCLVWERIPSSDLMAWADAVAYAYNKDVGGRGGWRLPTVEELRSLVDRTQGPPTLPAGHPFQNVQTWYWAATTDHFVGTLAWIVGFGNGDVAVGDKSTGSFYIWCVRGGQGHDGGH